ncbi:transposase [Thermanaerosceptrum fracticalcis]|uniref:transposase n=1 Tax=Thermanaerosceptrum fracticalcis TaxID=1712410 RepID=UPI001FADE075|nr:transposase [Thermanaerosceptrum fracticalcis]
MKKLCKPTFEKKDHGQGAGIPVLKTIWDLFDLSLLFSQSGIRKHSGIPAWLLAFAYICGLVNHSSSANQNAKEAPFLQQLLSGQIISQSAFSRFLSKPFQWLRFSLGRFARLQENTDSRLTDGDIIALDDTKIEHPHGKKIPFLCWLFDSSDKRHVWCINLVSTLAILKNGLEYPMLWRFWVKTGQENEKQSKLDLAKQMLAEARQLNKARLWVAMDRWFLCKKFLNWLMGQNFDWVTKAKRNTALFRKIYDPVLGKERYIKLNPKQLLREVYSQLRVLGKESVLSIPDIYIKMPYETLTRKGKPITRQRFLPIAAIAATYEKQAVEGSIVLPEEECPATFKDAYLLISNRVDTPEEAATAYVKRWRIEVFYRTAKQNLGLTSCYAQSETAHFAHVELLFTAKTLLCYASWECNKEGAEQAPSLCEVIRYFFNAGCRIRCCEQLIQVYFDTATQRFSRLIDKFWPHSLELRLWDWENYPETA